MNAEREKHIREILFQEKSVSVQELAQRLFASESSIRRDLESLERQNYLKRTHGGAVLNADIDLTKRIPYIIREEEQPEAKACMARKAAKLLKSDSLIMLDASTSACSLVPLLAEYTGIRVITSGVRTLLKLEECHVRTISTGGNLLSGSSSLVGPEALRTIAGYNADIAFCSCRGLTLDGTATDLSIEENVVRQKMWEQARVRVLLYSSQKLGRQYIHNLCHVEEVDEVISDMPLPKEWAGRIGRYRKRMDG